MCGNSGSTYTHLSLPSILLNLGVDEAVETHLTTRHMWFLEQTEALDVYFARNAAQEWMVVGRGWRGLSFSPRLPPKCKPASPQACKPIVEPKSHWMGVLASKCKGAAHVNGTSVQL